MRFLVGICEICRLAVEDKDAVYVANKLHCQSCYGIWGNGERPQGADCWAVMGDGTIVSGIIPVAVVLGFYRGEGIPNKMPFIPTSGQQEDFAARDFLLRIY